MGTAAIASAWTNWRATRSAGDELVRAQAQVFRDAVLSTNRVEPERRPAALDSIVSNHAEGGLRFAGWVRSDGTILAGGGKADPRPVTWSDTTRVEITRLASVVRAVFPPPKPSSRFRAFENVADPPPAIVVEFQPVLAESMAARAASTLAIAGVVALVLMAAALGFWRLAQRMEEQRRLSALGEMSAVLAHEIRNPLASLKGHAQLLAERLTDEQERRRVERVVSEATRLEALTGDLLDFSRSGPMDLRPVDPVALLRIAAAEAGGGGSIQIDGAGAPKSWQLDERRFRQAVLDNILRNAAQAEPADRQPQARVALEKGDLVFTIRDFGPGLPAGQEERIFDPFFTTRTTGTGLGLAVARRVVELHGGRLVAMNAPDGPGAIFRIELHGDNSRRR